MRGTSTAPAIVLSCLYFVAAGACGLQDVSETDDPAVEAESLRSPPSEPMSSSTSSPISRPDEAQPRLSAGVREVLYTLEWTMGDAVLAGDAAGWSVVNDQGFEVRVEDGWLVSAAMQLVPCPDEEPNPQAAGLGQKLWRWVMIPEAKAAHYEGPDDVSAVLTPIAESLLSPSVTHIGPVALGELPYCAVHYLVNKATSNTRNLPDSPSLAGVSLYLKGSHRAVDDETAEHTPFSVWCSMPVGRLPDLMSSAAAASPMVWDDLDSDLHVVITRELGRLFDGVNFETMSADGVQLRLLKSLSAQTIITANPVPPP